MDSKIKILIGVLVAMIILISGYDLLLGINTEPEKSKIESIEMIERGSYVPVYDRLEIRNDRTFFYEKGTYAPKKVEENYTGKIDEEDFIQLIDLLYKNAFFSMNKKHYNNPKILDASTTKITVWANKEEYYVSEYGGAGPKKLSEIKEFICNLKQKIESSNKR